MSRSSANRPSLRFACGAWLATGLWVSGQARADESEPVRFEYVAPEGCPREAEFVQAVERSTSRVQIAHEGDPARQFRVVLEVTGPELATGSLIVMEGGSAVSSRSVRAQSCAEAMQALAFIAALSIDPTANPSGSAEAIAPAVTAPAEVAPGAATDRTGSAQPAESPRATPKETANAVPERSSTRAPSRGRGSGRSEWAVGAGLDLLGLGGAGVGFAPRVFGAWRWETGGVVSPEVRLGAFRTVGVSLGSGETRTPFAWTFGRLEVAPVRFGRRLWAEPALLFDVGALTSSSEFSPTSPWLALGALGRVAVRPVRAFVIEGEVGGLVPFFRKTFEYQPAPAIYTPPSASPFGGIDAAVLFP